LSKKLMPRSMAVRTMRRLSCLSTFLRPMCQPPRPMADTRSPVWPRTRYGISDCVTALPPKSRAGSAPFSLLEHPADIGVRLPQGQSKKDAETAAASRRVERLDTGDFRRPQAEIEDIEVG